MSNRTTKHLNLMPYLIEREFDPPTIREIQHEFDISSTSVVNHYLAKLEGERLITRTMDRARGIKLVWNTISTHESLQSHIIDREYTVKVEKRLFDHINSLIPRYGPDFNSVLVSIVFNEYD